MERGERCRTCYLHAPLPPRRRPHRPSLESLRVSTDVSGARTTRTSGPRTDSPSQTTREAPSPGPLLGPSYRYQQSNLFERTFYDLAAIPANIPFWSLRDWAIFGGLAVSSGALLWPADPSLDVRLDRWITREVDPWMPDVWQAKFQGPFWAVLGVGTLGTWGIGALRGREDVVEGMSLMAEAVAVAQVYHIGLKLLTGRQGPRDGNGRGRFFGPARAFEIFPDGIPSGHFATIYAVFGSAQAYWRPPLAVDIGGHLLVGSLAATHVLNHRHFLSEIVLGAAMGYAISRWVVRHRSSRYEYRDGRSIRISLVPWREGLAVSGQF